MITVLLTTLLLAPPTPAPPATTRPLTTLALYEAAGEAALPQLDWDVAEELADANLKKIAAHPLVGTYVKERARCYELLRQATSRPDCKLPTPTESLDGAEFPSSPFRRAAEALQWKMYLHAGRSEWAEYEATARIWQRMSLHLNGKSLFASLTASHVIDNLTSTDLRVIQSQPPAGALQTIGQRMREFNQRRAPVSTWLTGEAEYFRVGLNKEYAELRKKAVLPDGLPPEVDALMKEFAFDPAEVVDKMTTGVTTYAVQLVHASTKALEETTTWVGAKQKLDELEAQQCAAEDELEVLQAKLRELQKKAVAAAEDGADVKPTLDEMVDSMTAFIGRLLGKMYVSTVRLCPVRHVRTTARLRQGHVASAIGRYLHKHGSLPAKLDDLMLPPADLIDPYDGGTLRYRTTAAGYLLWSCGKDLEDSPDEVSDDESDDFGDYTDDVRFSFTLPRTKNPEEG